MITLSAASSVAGSITSMRPLTLNATPICPSSMGTANPALRPSRESFAEERRHKTDQLLLTSPLSVPQIVVGKFFGTMAVFGIAMLIIMIYPPILNMMGDVNFRSGYSAIFGMFFMSCALAAIGIFISSLTESQVIAAVISTLHLQIILFPLRVRPIRIQTDGTSSDQPLHVHLRFQLCDFQIILAGEDSQHKLSQGEVVPEDATHKVVVNGSQSTQLRQILLPFPFFSFLIVFWHGAHLRISTLEINSS